MPLVALLPDQDIRSVGVWPQTRRFVVPTGSDGVIVGEIDGESWQVTTGVEESLGFDFQPRHFLGLDAERLLAADLCHVALLRARNSGRSLDPGPAWPLPERAWSAGPSLAASADGTRSFVAADTVLSHLGEPGSRSIEVEGAGIRGLAQARDFVVNGRTDGTVEIRDAESLELRRSFSACESEFLALAVDREGERLAVADDRAQVRVLDLQSAQDCFPVSGWSKVVGLHWLAEGRLLLVHLSRQITLLDRDRTVVETWRFPELGDRYIQRSALVGDGDGVLLACEQKGLCYLPLH